MGMRWGWCVVGLALPVVGCLSGSSASPAGGGGDAGASSSSGGGSSGSSSGSGGSSGSGSGSSSGGSSSGDASGGSTVPLTPTSTGYVDVVNLGIIGSWYAYGDGWGPSGSPPGDCETKGLHPSSACSVITSPAPSAPDGGGAGFPPSNAGMCLTGTAAQVVGTPPDYSNIFGIGIGLDLNNTGGTKAPYDAQSHHVVGFEFDVSGLPASGTVRVEIPIPGTDASGDAYSETVAAGTTHMAITWSDPGFGPSFPPPTGVTEPAFDPSKVESIQFHVVTETSASVPVTSFCIANLAAIVSP
jgi:hypothetical protein